MNFECEADYNAHMGAMGEAEAEAANDAAYAEHVEQLEQIAREDVDLFARFIVEHQILPLIKNKEDRERIGKWLNPQPVQAAVKVPNSQAVVVDLDDDLPF